MTDAVLLHGDCLQLLPLLPDDSVHMVLCDLPYGETSNCWDKQLDLAALFAQYRRVVRQQGAIVLFGSLRVGLALLAVCGDLYRYEWIWEKGDLSNPANTHCQPGRIHEHVYVFSRSGVVPNAKPRMWYYPQYTEGTSYSAKTGSASTNWHGMRSGVRTRNTGTRVPCSIQTVAMPRDERGMHPTQKPVALCEYFIRTYTQPGELVLDNCMGSGSTGVAALRAGRLFIGMEKDERYFAVAQARILQN